MSLDEGEGPGLLPALSLAAPDALLTGQSAATHRTGDSRGPVFGNVTRGVTLSTGLRCRCLARVDADAMRKFRPRVWLAPICLVVASILGAWAAGSMPNPPGNGPGSGQVLVGLVVPVCVALAACVLARIRAIEASLWALASAALTGGLVLFLMYFVEHVVRPA